MMEDNLNANCHRILAVMNRRNGKSLQGRIFQDVVDRYNIQDTPENAIDFVFDFRFLCRMGYVKHHKNEYWLASLSELVCWIACL